jgi:Protein of unknown function DUF262/Protein of unknown function (DUF1524)/Restriction Enzyme Adenine Methylase Associated
VETQVRTPQAVFFLPQRLMVPLFQRRYVWNRVNQWEALWEDVSRLAERILQRPGERPEPHFLGAVVVQQLSQPIGQLQARTIIDGQQRLTTLQLLLDALHAELLFADPQAALRIEQLVANSAPFCSAPDDRFKVWPTVRDREAFRAVMATQPPIDYETLHPRGELLVEAHRFFADQAHRWLRSAGSTGVAPRAAAIDLAVRDLLQLVVIDLGPDENAQEIFETLNARGTPLTAADLIKNFVFQRLSESRVDVHATYQSHWAEFESGFWEAEVSVGRALYSRSALFLNNWLVAKTGEDVLAREVFGRFKRFALQSGSPMLDLLRRIQEAAKVYRDFVTSSLSPNGTLDRLGLFGYRTGVMESEVVRPLVLYLKDPELPGIPPEQLDKALEAVESWMVRRMLVRATTKNYNQVMSALISNLRGAPDRIHAGDRTEAWLAQQTGASLYWPDDEEIRTVLGDLMAYRRLSRGRLRMVLEAVEDHLRGWTRGKTGYTAERVPRGTLAIEHVMPRKWSDHWRGGEDFVGEAERDRLIHTLGNLTLVTKRLNATISNGPWKGTKGKRAYLMNKEVLLLTKDLLERAGDSWTDSGIRNRTIRLTELIIEIWPVPAGHRSVGDGQRVRVRRKVRLLDLIQAGFLHSGMPLYPRIKAFASRVATLLDDGRIDVDGTAFSKPREAAAAIAGKPRGLWFFLVSQEPRRSLGMVKKEYAASVAAATGHDLDEGEED